MSLYPNLTKVLSLPNGAFQDTVKDLQISDDGNTIIFVAPYDLDNNNPGLFWQIFSVVDNEYTQITNFTSIDNDLSDVLDVPVLSGDGSTIVWAYDSDPLGTNTDLSNEVFSIDLSTSTLRQLTNDMNVAQRTSVTKDGSVATFVSADDLTTENGFLVNQVFTITTDGSATINQATNFTAAHSVNNHVISGDGTKVAFFSNNNELTTNADTTYELFIGNTDKSSLIQATDLSFDIVNNSKLVISDSGEIIAFNSTSNITGSNPTERQEIFTHNITTPLTVQITNGWNAISAVPTVTNGIGCCIEENKFNYFDLTANGSKVVYLHQGTGNDSLILESINVDGTDPTSIIEVPGAAIGSDFLSYPSTSGNGGKTVFFGNFFSGLLDLGNEAIEQIYFATPP